MTQLIGTMLLCWNSLAAHFPLFDLFPPAYEYDVVDNIVDANVSVADVVVRVFVPVAAPRDEEVLTF